MSGSKYYAPSAGVAASNAIERLLMQRAMEERQAMLDEQNRQKADEDKRIREQDLKLRLGREDMERDQFTADQAERARLAARQAQQDEIAATDRRDAKNQIGVRQMMAAGLQSGADPRTAQLQAFGEGVEIPMDVLDPERKTREATAADERNHQQRLAEIAAQGDQSRRTVAANLGGRGGQSDASAEYGIQTADRTIAAIDGVLPKITNTTAGVVGNFLGRTGLSQDAVDVSAELASVASNIAFNALQQMRAASKTGGALGAVSEREMDLLQSVEGSLRQNQSAPNLKAQLEKVRASMERFKAAQAMGGDLQMGRSGGSSFRVVGVR